MTSSKLSITSLLMWGLALVSAEADASVSVRFCIRYDVEYAENEENGQALGDDYMTDNGFDPIARGVYVQVKDQSGSLVYDDFTPSTGTYAGCTSVLSLSTNPGQSIHTVQAMSRSEVNGNTIHVLKNNYEGPTRSLSHGTYQGRYWASSPASVNAIQLVPGGSPTITIGPHEAWNVLMAASWALHRRNGGFIGNDYVLYSCPCTHSNTADPCDDESNGTPEPPTGGSCNEHLTNSALQNRIFVSDFNSAVKHTMAHELGHAILIQGLGHPISPSLNAWPDDCYGVQNVGWTHESKEFSSGGINEGFADYYAAVAFNDTSESDCVFASQTFHDWDQDGVVDLIDEQWFPIDCEGGPPGYAGPDYYSQQCLGGSEDDNRSAPFDWVRMFWDLDTDWEASYSIGVGDVLAIIDEANRYPTGAWNAWDASGDHVTTDSPAQRMAYGASAVGLGSPYATEAVTHGCWR